LPHIVTTRTLPWHSQQAHPAPLAAGNPTQLHSPLAKPTERHINVGEQ